MIDFLVTLVEVVGACAARLAEFSWTHRWWLPVAVLVVGGAGVLGTAWTERKHRRK